MPLRLRPLGTALIVAPQHFEVAADSLLVIPDSVREKPQTARVLAVGPDVKGVEVGNIVLHSRYAGSEVTIDGDDLLVLHAPDISAIVEPE
jgi:chaperonin GroES